SRDRGLHEAAEHAGAYVACKATRRPARLTRGTRIVNTGRDAPPRATHTPAPPAVAPQVRARPPRAVARQHGAPVAPAPARDRARDRRARAGAAPERSPGPWTRSEAPRAALARPRSGAQALDGIATRPALAAPGADPRVSRVRAAVLSRAGGGEHPRRAGAEARRAGLGLARPRASGRVGAAAPAPAVHDRARVHAPAPGPRPRAARRAAVRPLGARPLAAAHRF